MDREITFTRRITPDAPAAGLTSDPAAPPPGPYSSVLIPLAFVVGALICVSLTIILRFVAGAPLVWWHWALLGVALLLIVWWIVAASRQSPT